MNILEHQHSSEDHVDIASAAIENFRAAPHDIMAGSTEGWFAVGIPEDLGGAGGSMSELAPVIEACGASLTASALPWTTGVIARLLCAADSPPIDILNEISAGQRLINLPAVPSSQLLQDIGGPDDLSGSWIALGAPHGTLALPVWQSGSPALALVSADHPASSTKVLDATDLSRPWVRHTLDAVPLSECVVIDVPDLIQRWQALTGLVFALDSIGTARLALDRTVEYASVREQFGRPLGSFQSYKHHCADAFIDLKLAQSIAFRSAESIDRDAISPYAAGSAIMATRAATKICGRAIQLHGAIGFSWESGVHEYLRRTRANEILADAGAATQRLSEFAMQTVGRSA